MCDTLQSLFVSNSCSDLFHLFCLWVCSFMVLTVLLIKTPTKEEGKEKKECRRDA